MSYLLSYLLSAAISYIGYRGRALTAGGAVAACLVGGTIFALGGIWWAVLLVLFFVSSSLLSFFRASDGRKRQAAELFEKGGRRDAAQVCANGGMAALAAVFFFFQPGLLAFGAFLGALATATADTWATEIGVLSTTPPRLVTTLAPVPPGTSGGVTPLGTAATVAGALFIGLGAVVASLFSSAQAPGHALAILLCAVIGGTAGSLADSILGATVQAGYFCPVCRMSTESRVHRCGAQAQLIHGFAWINNDAVNFAATAVGGLVGAALLTLAG